MLVWSGLGIVVPVIFLLVTVAVREGLQTTGFTDNLALMSGLLLSAVIVWFVGRKLNDPSKGRIVTDVETGERLLLQNRHTFFWIKAEYWALIVPIVVGVVFACGK